MGLGGERPKPLGGGLIGVGDAKIVIGGRRVRMNADGTYSRFTRPPAEKKKAAGMKARKRARASRKTNR